MAGALGIGEYEAFITDNRRGDQVVVDLTEDLIRGQWDRALDAISRGEITVAATESCCEKLCKFSPIRHDLLIMRNGFVVWHGPIVRIKHSTSTQTARIEARDVVWWLTRRVVHNDLAFTGDLTAYARLVIEDAMEPDDRGILPHLTIVPGAAEGTRSQNALTVNSYEELRELARTVIDYTTVGKRLIIAPDLYPLGSLPHLGDNDFRGGIELLQDGLDYLNVSHVRGRNLIETRGAASDYYGLVEDILREFSIEDAASAQVAGDIQVEQGEFVPLLIFGEGGAFLSPEAVVDVNDLVPGIITRVTLRSVCPPVEGQDLRLVKVEFNWDNELGEDPGVRFGPIGTVNRQRSR